MLWRPSLTCTNHPIPLLFHLEVSIFSQTHLSRIHLNCYTEAPCVQWKNYLGVSSQSAMDAVNNLPYCFEFIRWLKNGFEVFTFLINLSSWFPMRTFQVDLGVTSAFKRLETLRLVETCTYNQLNDSTDGGFSRHSIFFFQIWSQDWNSYLIILSKHKFNRRKSLIQIVLVRIQTLSVGLINSLHDNILTMKKFGFEGFHQLTFNVKVQRLTTWTECKEQYFEIQMETERGGKI